MLKHKKHTAAWICATAALIGFHGTVRAAEAPRTVLSADFEAADSLSIAAPESTAVLTQDAQETVAGTGSLKGDSRASANEWNEFFHTRSDIFAEREAYKISFDYKILARDGDAQFYAMFRRKSDVNTALGRQDWTGSPGDRGHIETSFATRDAGDYYLMIGVQHKGAVSIDNLVIQTDPAHRPRDVRLPSPVRTWTSPGRTTYYVDSQRGADSADGKSPAHAWRTLGKVNAGVFAPGDKILLRADGRWDGFLAPGGKGAAGAPIVIDRYGQGPKPRIDAHGFSLATLFLHNTEYIETRNLDLANKGETPEPKLAAIEVTTEDFGTAHHVTFQSLDIHDVTGDNIKANLRRLRNTHVL